MNTEMAGLWEPHSASIDFCENNYIHSNRIVEFHNTWSSVIGISSFGMIGILSGNPTKERRHIIAYLILVFIGIGSAGLHGTLHHIFQSSDELPMIYLVNSLLYMLAEFDAPQIQPKHPYLPLNLFGISILNTLIYYRFQQIYYVFIATFVSETTVLIIWLYKILYLEKERSSTTKDLGKMAVFNLVGVGFPLWIFDMIQCERVKNFSEKLPGIFNGATPHIVWHFTAGFASYCLIMCMCCLRMEELNIPFTRYNILGFFPVIKRSNDKSHNIV